MEKRRKMPRIRPGNGVSVMGTILPLLLLFLGGAWGEELVVYKATNYVTLEDIAVGGECDDGCVRHIEAEQTTPGPPALDDNCAVAIEYTQSTTVHTTPSFTLAHYCEDDNGIQKAEGAGACVYDICADFSFNSDTRLLKYKIAIAHGAAPVPRSVTLTLTMNYSPFGFPNVCAFTDACSDLPACVGGRLEADIVMSDANGDGWGGAISDAATEWVISRPDGNAVNTGSLVSGSKGTDVACLEAGNYVFSVTEDAAWAADTTWSFCGRKGAAGDSFPFSMSAGGDCRATGDVSAAAGPGEPTKVASDPQLCALPSTPESCTAAALSSKLPAGVGAYYDETCSERLTGGCGNPLGFGLDSCRLCVWSEYDYLQANPSGRVPDYVACPCCVASAFGEACDTPTPAPPVVGLDSGSGSGATRTALLATTSLAIALLLVLATVLLLLRRRDRRREQRPPIGPVERSDKSGFRRAHGGRRRTWWSGLLRREGRPAINPGEEDFKGGAPVKDGRRRIVPHAHEDQEDSPPIKGKKAPWSGEPVVPVSSPEEESFSEPEHDGEIAENGGGSGSGRKGLKPLRADPVRGLSRRRFSAGRPPNRPVLPEEPDDDDDAGATIGSSRRVPWAPWAQRAPAWEQGGNINRTAASEDSTIAPGGEGEVGAGGAAVVCSSATTENGDHP